MLPLIPEGQPEHPGQPLKKAFSQLLVKMDHGFGIAPGVELMAFGLQVLSKLREVVDLAIADYPDGLIFVVDGLVSGLQVNDREATDSQADGRGQIVAFVIWPPMAKHLGHSAEHFLAYGLVAIQGKIATDSTHLR